VSVSVITGDCRDVLATLPAKHFHTCVTSPPYFGLRDYGVDGQIGLEPTPDEFVGELVKVFREVRRVLRDDGTVWLNLGDSYARQGGKTSGVSRHWDGRTSDPGGQHHTRHVDNLEGLKPKDLIGIPWRVAFALQADGWYLRQDIIWSKPNPMPESVTDRCTKAHEYIFLLSKSPRYWFDAKAIAEPFADERMGASGVVHGVPEAYAGAAGRGGDQGLSKFNGADRTGRNRRSVWTVATQPFSQAHFATFPPALIEPCILAGCPAQCCEACGAPYERQVERGAVTGRHDAGGVVGMADAGMYSGRAGNTEIKTTGFAPTCTCGAGIADGNVLDPFGGAGTTGMVADRLQRNATLIELNPAYAKIAHDRMIDDGGMFTEVAAE